MDLFIAPSRYFAELMQRRLKLAPERVRVLPNGLNLDGYAAAPGQGDVQPPVLGYFARMCREKGLETLVNAFIVLKKRGRVRDLKLRVGGSCGPADQVVVDELRARLEESGLLADVEFHPNLSRADKQAFLRSLSVFSVPAIYGEAFGLYVIEALACGVPVVQPRHAAFPELIAATGGGLLCAPGTNRRWPTPSRVCCWTRPARARWARPDKKPSGNSSASKPWRGGWRKSAAKPWWRLPAPNPTFATGGVFNYF